MQQRDDLFKFSGIVCRNYECDFMDETPLCQGTIALEARPAIHSARKNRLVCPIRNPETNPGSATGLRARRARGPAWFGTPWRETREVGTDSRSTARRAHTQCLRWVPGRRRRSRAGQFSTESGDPRGAVADHRIRKRTSNSGHQDVFNADSSFLEALPFSPPFMDKSR